MRAVPLLRVDALQESNEDTTLADITVTSFADTSVLGSTALDNLHQLSMTPSKPAAFAGNLRGPVDAPSVNGLGHSQAHPSAMVSRVRVISSGQHVDESLSIGSSVDESVDVDVSGLNDFEGRSCTY